MNTQALVITWATPVFFVLIALELLLALWSAVSAAVLGWRTGVSAMAT